MPTTSLTLLERLRRPDQPAARERFVRLYAPLLMQWARVGGFQETDAEDLVQTVLVKLLRLLPAYQRAEGGSFRGWLFVIARNEARDFRTRRGTRTLHGDAGLDTVPAPAAEPGEVEYRRALARRALELVQGEFEPNASAAFTGFVIDGRPAVDVALALGTTPNAVYLARNRVLTRVRAELSGLLD